MTITNPLLLQNPIEHVNDIDANYVEPAIEQIIADNRQQIAALTQLPNKTWENFMLPMDILENRLGKAWSPVSHLNSVCNSQALREAYDKGLSHLTDYSTQLGQDKALFSATQALYDDRENLQLTATQTHILKDSLLGFRLSGVDLSEALQAEFAKIQKRLSQLKSKFEHNILDATMSWRKPISDKNLLNGLPETELEILAANAKARGESGYLITLEIPSYLAILTYADDRKLREEVYYAYVTRASELGFDKGQYDNGPIMEEILSLKNAKAKLLGFDNFAQLSLESKMAESPEQVIAFLEQLNHAAHQQAKDELATLQAYAKQSGIDELASWDVAYYSEKLKQKTFEISQSELRPYFVVDKVMQGLFDLTEQLFNVTFQQTNDKAIWHPKVRHYELLRDNQVIAEFYLDLFARQHKRGGAWMDVCQSRYKTDTQQIQIPIAYLTCNFAEPAENKPALLTHDEVVTLFHEFGHGIHHMLTQVDELAASGISNVPWDAVELPSQFMENFCYHPEVINQISGHYETGEPLPENKLNKLIEAKNFQSAMMMVRQIEFSLFDIKIHMAEPLKVDTIQQELNEIRKAVAVMPPPEFNRFQHSFSHIFAGGYAAGYYSYKWAEVLSADAFSLFEEEGVLNQAAGRKFLTNILEKGGSADPMELFVAFRGRKPSVEPLLRHAGIDTSNVYE
ncbi:M3 family metallopeptidase [Aliikangiella maris]